jgi:hypothetical protein
MECSITTAEWHYFGAARELTSQASSSPCHRAQAARRECRSRSPLNHTGPGAAKEIKSPRPRVVDHRGEGPYPRASPRPSSSQASLGPLERHRLKRSRLRRDCERLPKSLADTVPGSRHETACAARFFSTVDNPLHSTVSTRYFRITFFVRMKPWHPVSSSSPIR